MLSLLFLKHNHKLGVSLDAAAEQDETPLIDALVKASGSVRAPFFFPGHKMGSGAPRRPCATDCVALLAHLGSFQNSTPLRARGADSQNAGTAAKAFSAERTWCLANGSTAGVLASDGVCRALAAAHALCSHRDRRCPRTDRLT